MEIKLNGQQKSKLRELLKTDGFEVMLRVANIMIVNAQGREVKDTDQFNTTWNMASTLGEIRGIKDLLKTLEDLANDRE